MHTKGKTMRAAVLSAPGKINIVDLPRPEARGNLARVRLRGCGLCGSNLPPWEGRSWFKYPFAPGAPGHEGWGEVEAIGGNVTKFKPGDRVALLSFHAFAEFDVADENSLVLLPTELRDQPFPGEALGCAINVIRRCEIRSGQSVAIIGIGFLGALLTSLAVQGGAKVFAISRRAFALDIARCFGASETSSLCDDTKIISEIKMLTNEIGCDCVIEAAGQQQSLNLAGELTRERGRLVVAGYHQDGPRTVNMQLWNWRGLDVINAHERDPRIYIEGIQAAANSVARGQLNPLPLYTHSYPLERISEAFEAMKSRPNNFLKALIKM